jgi:acyl-CoA synthetase (NDP forming)/GNAT superfamily N-acetyltransferase
MTASTKQAGRMTAAQTQFGGIDAIRADGGLVHIRMVMPSDLAALRALHARCSDRSMYLRFFSPSRPAADAYLTSLIGSNGGDRVALVACVHDEIVGVATYERLDDARAEIALLVSDDSQHEGIGTLLLEHLASVARHMGIRRFVADVLTENSNMVHLLHDLGFEMNMALDRGTMRVALDLAPSDRAVHAIDERERTADTTSLSGLLTPRSIAIIGASERRGSVGNQVLRNVLDSGFTGSVHVVNPRHASILGLPSLPSAAQLPLAPDLAIVAVPAAHVRDVVRVCGERGAGAVLLLSAGFSEAGAAGKGLQDEVLAIARHYGMRLVGPNCVGVVNTNPSVRLNATFAAIPMVRGKLGMLSQSGAFGIAFLAAAARSGLGVSQFVSVGNKADVSGNDLLLYWEDDPATSVIALYLESLGDPIHFAHIARRVSRRKPILAIKSGRTVAGRRAGQSHTAAAASSEVAVDALFRASGVLRVTTMQGMLDAARVLVNQPLPTGPRVAIVGNSGGPGILAADAVAAAGLTVVELDEQTQKLLRRAVPTAASVQNPVDLGALVSPKQVGDTLRVVLACGQVDSVLTVFTQISLGDADQFKAATAEAAATTDKLIVATDVGGQAAMVPVAGTSRSVPVFDNPEPAAAAIGVAHEYAQIRATKPEPAAHPVGIKQAPARALVDTALAAGTEWLDADEVARLLSYYDIPMCPQRVVNGPAQAARAATDIGYPVAVKLAGAGVHKTEVGGVRLGITCKADLRAACADIAAAVSATAPTLLVQPMIHGGTELIVGAVHDQQFGALVMLGAGGTLADILDDRGFRLAPLSESDADELIGSLRVARLLDGFRGAPVVPRSAVRDVLVRVAALAADVPEIAELDLNPLVCHGEDLLVVDARIRIAPVPPIRDPLVRGLRGSAPSSDPLIILTV